MNSGATTTLAPGAAPEHLTVWIETLSPEQLKALMKDHQVLSRYQLCMMMSPQHPDYGSKAWLEDLLAHPNRPVDDPTLQEANRTLEEERRHKRLNAVNMPEGFGVWPPGHWQTPTEWVRAWALKRGLDLKVPNALLRILTDIPPELLRLRPYLDSGGPTADVTQEGGEAKSGLEDDGGPVTDAVLDVEGRLFKLRAPQRDRLLARMIARQLWREDPTRTITEICAHELMEVVLEGAYKGRDTRHNWIADLDPRGDHERRGPPRRKGRPAP